MEAWQRVVHVELLKQEPWVAGQWLPEIPFVLINWLTRSRFLFWNFVWWTIGFWSIFIEMSWLHLNHICSSLRSHQTFLAFRNFHWENIGDLLRPWNDLGGSPPQAWHLRSVHHLIIVWFTPLPTLLGGHVNRAIRKLLLGSAWRQ